MCRRRLGLEDYPRRMVAPAERIETSSRRRGDISGIVAVAGSLIGVVIGGLISYGVTRSQEQHQDAQARVATIQQRAAALIAAGYQMEKTVFESSTNSSAAAQATLQAQNVTLQSQESSLLLATTTEPMTKDVLSLTRVIQRMAEAIPLQTPSEGSSLSAEYQSAVQKLESDINPTLHLEGPNPSPHPVP